MSAPDSQLVEDSRGSARRSRSKAPRAEQRGEPLAGLPCARSNPSTTAASSCACQVVHLDLPGLRSVEAQSRGRRRAPESLTERVANRGQARSRTPRLCGEEAGAPGRPRRPAPGLLRGHRPVPLGGDVGSVLNRDVEETVLRRRARTLRSTSLRTPSTRSARNPLRALAMPDARRRNIPSPA